MLSADAFSAFEEAGLEDAEAVLHTGWKTLTRVSRACRAPVANLNQGFPRMQGRGAIGGRVQRV